jgi:hypothetical protein
LIKIQIMVNFNQPLQWLNSDPYLPINGNRINQQYDKYSINDLYLGYAIQEKNTSTSVKTIESSEVIDPFLVQRCSPYKQPIVDLLSEAISRAGKIDRYREDIYDVKKQITNTITRIASVDYCVYARFITNDILWDSSFANPQFLNGFYNHTIDGNLLAYPELNNYALTRSDIPSDYFVYGSQSILVPLNTVIGDRSTEPVGTLIIGIDRSYGNRYRYLGGFTITHSYDAAGTATPPINVYPPIPFPPRSRLIDGGNGHVVTASEQVLTGFKFNFETIANTSFVDL